MLSRAVYEQPFFVYRIQQSAIFQDGGGKVLSYCPGKDTRKQASDYFRYFSKKGNSSVKILPS